MNLIQAQGICRHFVLAGNKKGKSCDLLEVVDNVSFEVSEGSIVSILGPSGCGKSTILEMVAGLQLPDGGNLEVRAGVPDEKNPRPSISMVFQDYAIFPWMTVRGNLEYVLALAKIKKQDRLVRVRKALEEVNLESCEDYFPRQLSGGMKQRLALARALIVQPGLLLLDEPFASVDQMIREDLQNLLQDLLLKTRATALIVTHDLKEAVYLSDKIIVLSGRPCKIMHEQVIDLPRPRDRNDTLLLGFEKEILSLA